jgi:hypothetical protein
MQSEGLEMTELVVMEPVPGRVIGGQSEAERAEVGMVIVAFFCRTR